MRKSNKTFVVIVLLAILTGLLLTACGGSTGTTGPSTANLDGKALMQERCSVCHSTGRITSTQMTQAEWTDTVQVMVGRGAQLNAAEQQTLIDYLAANYK